jgi:hypothetical protein
MKISSFLLLIAVSCTPPDPVAPKPPPADLPACERACINMENVNRVDPCPGYTGKHSPAGTACSQACADAEAHYPGTFCPGPLAEAHTCTELKTAAESCR